MEKGVTSAQLPFPFLYMSRTGLRDAALTHESGFQRSVTVSKWEVSYITLVWFLRVTSHYRRKVSSSCVVICLSDRKSTRLNSSHRT